jgi:membrane protease YdiL (CAAX protease family)
MKTISSVFWNPLEHRLRAAWRIILQGLLFFLLIAISTGLVQLLSSLTALLLSNPGASSFAARLLSPIAFTAGAFASLAIAGLLLDRRPFADFGFHFNRSWWLDFGFGLGLGAILMLLIFLVEQSLGWITITNNFFNDPPSLALWKHALIMLIQFIAVGFYEEIFSRSYQLRNLAEGFSFLGRKGLYGLLAGWLLSSSVFGFLHLGNPNSTLISTLNLIVAGLFLGLGYVLTREMAIPIGLHITWNYFQGIVFGFPVSGSQSGLSFIQIQQKGPDLLTGGAFGPEAGIIGLAAMLLGSLLIILWVKQTRHSVALQSQLAQYQPPIKSTAGN